MNARILLTCFLIVTASAATAETPALLESEPITAGSIRDWILQLESMPCGHPYEDRDPDLWQIVRLGLEHVPTILELVDDGTDTGMTVCLFGGTYAVGDVAVAAFMSLVDDVPVALMAADGDQKARDGMGFGPYWWFVRESGDHRHSLRRSLEAWFSANRSRLEWVRVPASPAGGHYRVAGDGPSEQ